jgi:Uma2 family endonuclease
VDTRRRFGANRTRRRGAAFVRRDRVEAVWSKSFAKGAPDLAVEIFSPSDGTRQATRKVRQYLAAGSHTVWVFYPKRQRVKVFEASGAERTLYSEDLLDPPDLLPGFSVKVAELFS